MVKLNVRNVGGYIRLCKSLGIRKILWVQEEYDTLLLFLKENGFTVNGERPIRFMGADHYLVEDKYLTGK